MEIIPGVHLIEQMGIGQAYLYQEADRLTLIDTGLAGDAERIFSAIEVIGRRPNDLRQIVITHCHADHVGSLAEVAERSGAQVLVHALDAPVVRGLRPAPEPLISDAERPMYEQAVRLTPTASPPPAPVDRELKDGDEVDVDGGARVVQVPGHTPGSIALYLPGRRVLFAGDAAARDPDDELLVGVFNVDPAQARQSFRRLAELDFEVACFGHGRPLDREASLAFRRAAARLR